MLLRRTRLALLDARALPGEPATVQRVAQAVGDELRLGRERVRAEADGFRAEAVAEGLLV